ncbi:MAG: DUF4118 domain-containing protein [Clostridiales bacterium]|nr:DUF4118 domain-containing protein [Clostridiales bacterium]
MIPRRQTKREFARDMAITLVLLGAAALFCAMLNMIGDSDSAVPLVFVLAVLLTARFTDGYFYGLFATVASVFGVNYAFTYPYFEFNFAITGYPFTFLTMFAVSLVVGMLTEQVKRQGRIEAEVEREKMKANLLRSVSHDLRTPLTGIIGSSNVMLEQYDLLSDEEKKELVEHVREDAQWLVRLVENILSITRIKDGVVQLKKSPEVAEEIIAEAVGKFRKNRKMPVHVKLPDEMLMIPMDATLIEQVLVNLMENVVIHAEGATEIRISISRIEENQVQFCVEDNGKGIDEDILPKLFEELFPHAKEKNADGRRSMGIGLSACMSIVKAHGGDMYAQNRPEGGARVRFVLPTEEEKKNGGQG